MSDCADCGKFTGPPTDYDYHQALAMLEERIDLTSEQKQQGRDYLDQEMEKQHDRQASD